MANNIDKKEPVANCDQSKIDVTKCDNHELAGNIEPLIKVIRGQQVMLDKDLAMLYGVEVKVLNQAVKRNVERFPNDFRFQLTKEECLRSQIVTLNGKQGQHLKYETVLTLLDKRENDVSAVIYTQQISRQFQLDIDRHNAQYAPIDVETFFFLLKLELNHYFIGTLFSRRSPQFWYTSSKISRQRFSLIFILVPIAMKSWRVG